MPGSPGTANGGTCVDTASCDTEKFVAAVNAAGLCGHSDWRLPSRDELFGLLDGTTGSFGLSSAWFPNSPTTNQTYWSATAVGAPARGASPVGLSAWNVSLAAQGTTLTSPRLQGYAVRLVRGGT